MPIIDFFRNLFGKGSSSAANKEPPQNSFEDGKGYRDSFRNPIWQTDEEDEEDVGDFGRRHRFQFKVFTDPFEMTRFFENQMDDMLKNFFGGFNGFGNDSTVFFKSGLPEVAPFVEEGKPMGPRDEVLKPSYDEPGSNFSFGGKTTVDQLLKPSYELPNGEKQDSDIDGRLESNKLAEIWKSPTHHDDVKPFAPPSFSFRSIGKSVSTQLVRRADGSIEQRRTIRDSNGNEETTITRQLGDKVHSVVTKKAKDGSEVKSEDIVNMDESELEGFNEKWTNIQTPKNADDFPWYKLFGPNPKL